MTTLEDLISRYNDLQTLIGRTAMTSVKVRGIYIRADNVQWRLHKFAKTLVRHTGDEQYSLQCIGSASGLSLSGRCVFVTTKHQLRSIPRDDVGIVRIEERQFLSSAGWYDFNIGGQPLDGDGADLCAFEYTEAAHRHPDIADHFFSLDENTALKRGDQVIALLAYGCPFVDQDYDIVERNHVGLLIRSVTCELSPQSSDPMLGSCSTLSEMDFDPNGMSGGPIFATVIENHELVLKFAGIVNRAGNGSIHFIRVESVLRLMNAARLRPTDTPS